jgi:hypothetical protein
MGLEAGTALPHVMWGADANGSPIIPTEAIEMADLIIPAGQLHRWSCARLLGFAH